MKKLYYSERDNYTVYTEGFEVGSRGFMVDEDEQKVYKLQVVVFDRFTILDKRSKSESFEELETKHPEADIYEEFVTDNYIFDVGFVKEKTLYDLWMC